MPRQILDLAAIPIDGAALRQLRKQRGLSVKSLATRWGITESYVRHIETGARNLSVETYHRLLAVLHLRYGALIRQIDDEDGQAAA